MKNYDPFNIDYDRYIELLEDGPENPTIGDIIYSDELCEAYGIDPWCVNEGQADGSEQLYTIPRIEELREYAKAQSQ